MVAIGYSLTDHVFVAKSRLTVRFLNVPAVYILLNIKIGMRTRLEELVMQCQKEFPLEGQLRNMGFPIRHYMIVLLSRYNQEPGVIPYSQLFLWNKNISKIFADLMFVHMKSRMSNLCIHVDLILAFLHICTKNLAIRN